MSVEDGAKLYDVCPHVSDSVRSHWLSSVTAGVFTLISFSAAASRTEQLLIEVRSLFEILIQAVKDCTASTVTNPQIKYHICRYLFH